MMTLYSPEELQEYCLRELGKPVINIAIDDTQLEQQIDNALQFFIQNHYDGATERYIKYTVTAQDVINGYLSIPENICEVVEIYDPSQDGNNVSGVEEFERLNFNIANSDIVDQLHNSSDSMGLSGYYLAREGIATLRHMFTPKRMFEFNKVQGTLNVHAQLVAGNFIFLHAYETLDPDIDVNIFNQIWMKEYATALVKRQWGANTKKYQNVQMAGGITMDGQTIFNEADADVKRLREEFLQKYTLPPQFFMG